MFLLGFVISYWSARRTLHRVERITETVARIGTEGLEERLPEPLETYMNLICIYGVKMILS
jgi:hypothetical protein